MSELRKKTEKLLLTNHFPEHSLVSKTSSNNGFSYVLKKDGEFTYVKVVDLEQEDEEGLDETLLNQLSSGSSHIVEFIDSSDIDDKYGYLQFEYIDGQDLPDLPTPMSNDDLIKLASDMILAIDDLWKCKIVHRDIKPRNIMKTSQGDYKLVDLGIGYYMETQDRDSTKSRGSRYYSSPEQFFSSTDGRVEISFSSDLYSLGMVLFELASGHHPKASWANKSCYGETITQTEPPKIEEHRSDLSNELTALINKLLAVYTANRFLSPKQALDFLNGTAQAKLKNRIFLHDTSTYKVIDTYLGGGIGDAPSGVVGNALQSTARIQNLKKLGIEVLIDPLTYRLPHPLATNTVLKKKFGYKKKVFIDASRVRSDSKPLIENVLKLQKEATSFILPYFAIESLEDEFVEINKKMWREGKAIAANIDKNKKVYGGIVIPSSIVKQTTATNKFINLMLSQYNVDGFYVIFESPNDTVKTIDSTEYLQGVKSIINALKSMGEVVVAHSDCSYQFILDGVDLAVGWSNSKRRFLYGGELQGKKTGFLNPNEYDPKLLYYIRQLTTFVKGEEEVENVHSFAPTDSLECSCDSCENLSPFDGVTPKDLELAELHYYQAITGQLKVINTDPIVKKRALLQKAATLATEISKSSGGTVGREVIPSHEAILSVVNK